MDLSDKGLALLKGKEGCRLVPYPDAGGESICYGHFLRPQDSWMRTNMNQELCEIILKHDCAWAVKAVNSMVLVPLNQNQFDALVDFVYNVGETHFRQSTLLRLLNEGKYREAAEQLPLWIFSNGSAVTALVDRRAAERALFLET